MAEVSLDVSNSHVMQSYVRGNEYVYLIWPKNTTLRDLEWIREACNQQLDTFIRHARRETEKEEAARLEVESWNCSAIDAGVPPVSQASDVASGSTGQPKGGA